MSDQISQDTRVWVVAIGPITNKRQWMVKYDQRRDSYGTLVPWPFWSSNASDARNSAMTFQYATTLRARFWDAHRQQLHFTTQCADSAPFINLNSQAVERREDDRVSFEYRGLLIRPFVTVNAKHMWLCKLYQPGFGDREPIKGNSPEEVGESVIERGLFEIAEKAPVMPPPPKPQQQRTSGPVYRLRPGDVVR
jgi:hypothetical protein